MIKSKDLVFDQLEDNYTGFIFNYFKLLKA